MDPTRRVVLRWHCTGCRAAGTLRVDARPDEDERVLYRAAYGDHQRKNPMPAFYLDFRLLFVENEGGAPYVEARHVQ